MTVESWLFFPSCGGGGTTDSWAHDRCLSLYEHELNHSVETDTWRFRLEAGHHASSAQRWDYIEKNYPMFGDHYNLYGKRASLAAQKTDDEQTFELAVHFFEQTLEIDPEDDYAHHYLAYNLDYAALDEGRSEEHYHKAIEIAPDRPWWHSRYVSFLVTVGRTEDGEAAWNEAQDALLETKQVDNRRVYEDFHRWVLRLLLHRSQLDFAADVLRDVPECMRDEIRGMRLMEAILASMVDAEAGRDVYPVDVPLSERWVAPRLLTGGEEEQHVDRWLAGRVEDRTDDAVVLLLAERAEPEVDIRYFHSEIPLALFGELSDTKAEAVHSGDYLEFLVFKPSGEEKEGRKVIRFARCDGRSSFKDLPPLKPDPRRYLRRKGWIGEGDGQTGPA